MHAEISRSFHSLLFMERVWSSSQCQQKHVNYENKLSACEIFPSSKVQTIYPLYCFKYQYTRVLVWDTESVWKIKTHKAVVKKNQNTQSDIKNESTTKRVQKLNSSFVESKQREHLFRNFIFHFTVQSPHDNVSNRSPIKTLNRS